MVAAAGTAGALAIAASPTSAADAPAKDVGTIPAFQGSDTLKPLSFDPAKLSGLTERLIRSHWENNYGGSVKALTVVKKRLAQALGDKDLPPYVYNDLKREHLLRTGSVVLHELYFDNLGGSGQAGASDRQSIAQAFGTFDTWETEFRRIGAGLGGGSGWVVLGFNQHTRQLENYWMADHGHAPAATLPILVMDMYEHAYQMDFGANATAYIDTFFRNINWETVLKRIAAARNDQPPPNEDPSWTADMPSLSVEELAAQIANGSGVQIIDARAREHMSLNVDLMAGATWRDPDRVEEWIAELTPGKPVAVYCSYGFDVGRNVTKTLIERGFDARFVRGGIAAWYASGGARALKPTAG